MLLRYQGVVMGGRGGALLITAMTAPVVERRGEFTDRLAAHGQASSRQWLGGRSWSWTLATNRRSLAEALASAAVVERAWLDYADMASTATVPLEYSHDDGRTWFRVYGRPGRVTTPVADVRAVQGAGFLDLEFRQTDPLHYSSMERTATITAAPAVLGVLTVPVRVPVVVGASGAERAGRVSNVGDKPTPVRVTFHGPSLNPRVRTSAGYEIGYRGSLAWDETVVLDPLAQSVLLNGTTPVPGRLTPRSLLSDLVAPTGDSDWRYIAVDESGTSRAVLSWRDAFTSMQYGGGQAAPVAPPSGANVRIAPDGVPYLDIDRGTHIIAQAEDGTPYVVQKWKG